MRSSSGKAKKRRDADFTPWNPVISDIEKAYVLTSLPYLMRNATLP
jgi:hypothetical protein